MFNLIQYLYVRLFVEMHIQKYMYNVVHSMKCVLTEG